MDAELILDTPIVESLWNGGPGTDWVGPVARGEVRAALSALSLLELITRTPDRQAEIQLSALIGLTRVIPMDANIARRAGTIVRDLETEDEGAALGAVVAATALESDLPVACVDDEFFTAMGCEIADAR